MKNEWVPILEGRKVKSEDGTTVLEMRSVKDGKVTNEMSAKPGEGITIHIVHLEDGKPCVT